jgi:hypothetical protein
VLNLLFGFLPGYATTEVYLKWRKAQATDPPGSADPGRTAAPTD